MAAKFSTAIVTEACRLKRLTTGLKLWKSEFFFRCQNVVNHRMKQSKRKENNKRNGNDTHTNWLIQMQSETVVIIMWCQRGIALFMLCACLWRKYVHFYNLITFQRTKPAIKFRILPEMHCKWMRLQWSESSLACQPTSATQRNNRSTKWNYEQAQKRLNFFGRKQKKNSNEIDSRGLCC